MGPLEGERVVLEANNKTLTVTTHRVRYAGRVGGSARVVSIMLEEVSSCELTHTTYPALLVLAGLAFVAGLAMNSARDSTPVVVGLLVAAIFVAAYLGTRKQILRVASPSGHIDALLVGMTLEKATEVIDTVEWAKDGRYRFRQA
jgi:hypothetical protein